jgi:hypothetical protein
MPKKDREDINGPGKCGTCNDESCPIYQRLKRDLDEPEVHSS